MPGSDSPLIIGEGLGELRTAPVGNLGSPEISDSTAQSEASKNVPNGNFGKQNSLPPLIGINDLVDEAPPWLISAGVHLALLIILGLLIFTPKLQDELTLRFGSEAAEDALTGDDFEMPLEIEEMSLDAALAPQQVPEIEEAVKLDPTLLAGPLVSEEISTDVDPIRMALTGREKGMRESLLEAYGGTRGTQKAVMEGLKWLQRRQGSDGMWSLTGPYPNGASTENKEAATGLALIAFQGAGYTPEGDSKGPFTRTVARGWTSLLASQADNGNFFQDGRGTGRLYTHAICTIAICELYGMTRESKYRDAAQRAINYCVKTQAPEGGWRYTPNRDNDLSVTGWFVIALQSARMAGLDVPSTTLSGIRDYLDIVSRNGGSEYAYSHRHGPTLSMTSEGLLSRQYLGWRHEDPRLQRGADLLIENLPSWEEGDRDCYYWYYATQVCHHMESHHWRVWNERMREVIPSNQILEGRERGSWDPRGDRWATSGGRLFGTCLSIYMLEVYYRHLPIYQLDLLSGGN